MWNVERTMVMMTFGQKMDVTGVFTTRQHADISQEWKDDETGKNIRQDSRHSLNESRLNQLQCFQGDYRYNNQTTVEGHETIQLQLKNLFTR